jgi:hypothetical protein
VPIFIGRGAPFAYKTTNISVLGLFTGDGGLQEVPAADDPDGPVVDLDRVDDGTDVAFARKRVDLLRMRLRKSGCQGGSRHAT